ncbi:MAG: sigma-54 dependent transcriptional regulator [Planctomycetota bacterium]
MSADSIERAGSRPYSILVVDDHISTVETISEIVEEMGHRPIACLSAEEAYRILSQEEVDVVLSDLVLTGDSGLKLLEYVRSHFPDIPTVLISGHGTVETAVSALKEGALDFLVKPIDLTRVRAVINVAVRFRASVLENRYLASRLREKDVLERIVGRSPAILRVKQLISQVAPSRATVLVTGESGTGKELVAEAIHHLSPRASRPLVSINSAALSQELLESELFGHEKGSFTGALRTKPGQFEVADGGTIFFDEIGDMPLSIQAKILRVLERRNFQRVGGTKSITVDVRVIAATNADLKKAMEENRFRQDLYYRLNVISIEMPPLRDRRDDIPLLISHFLSDLNRRDGRSCSIEPEALDAMYCYDWPGNVRELRNALERAFLVSSDDRIRKADLPQEISRIVVSSPSFSAMSSSYAGKTMEAIEKEAILATLEATAWNKSKAAQSLDIGLKTLYRKLEKWGIHDSSDRSSSDEVGESEQ